MDDGRKPESDTPMFDRAIMAVRRQVIEECAQICLQQIWREAGYQGQWEGYGGWDGDMTGPECAAAIRALLDKEADDEAV